MTASPRWPPRASHVTTPTAGDLEQGQRRPSWAVGDGAARSRGRGRSQLCAANGVPTDRGCLLRVDSRIFPSLLHFPMLREKLNTRVQPTITRLDFVATAHIKVLSAVSRRDLSIDVTCRAHRRIAEKRPSARKTRIDRTLDKGGVQLINTGTQIHRSTGRKPGLLMRTMI